VEREESPPAETKPKSAPLKRELGADHGLITVESDFDSANAEITELFEG
jgi:hypothetical protein